MNQAMMFVGGIGAGAIGGGFLLGKAIGNRLGQGKKNSNQPLPSESALSHAVSHRLSRPLTRLSRFRRGPQG